MPIFYTISTVRVGIEKYKKTSTHSKCCEDLCKFFTDLTFDQIFEHAYRLQDYGTVRYIKLRIPCSTCGGTGKSGGYRAYVLVDNKLQSITLLAFYPKSGKYGQSDISRDHEKAAFELYKAEKGANELQIHDILKNFSRQITLA